MVDHNSLNVGDIVYHVTRNKYNFSYHVEPLYITDIFIDGLVCEKIVLKEDRLINNIPYNDFKTPTPWRKLPRGWTYNTELYIHDFCKHDNMPVYHINNTEEIKSGIKCGDLILGTNKDWSHIEVEIDKNLGYRLIRKYNSDEYHGYVRVNYYEAYSTYDEAQKWIDNYEAELARQSELSDEEWSIEQIEHTVNKYVSINYADEDVRKDHKDKLMNYFTSLKNIEDIETRVSVNGIEWKYWKNKKWGKIEDNLL